MKNKILISSTFLMVGLTACSSCAKKEQVDQSTVPTTNCNGTACVVPLLDASLESTSNEDASQTVDAGQPASLNVGEDNWKFILPGSGWVKENPPSPLIKVVYSNDSLNAGIIVVKEPTTNSFDDYALNVARALRSSGGIVLSGTPTTVNGVKYVLIQADQNPMTIWVWATVKDNFGYGFSCGGLKQDSGNSLQQMCFATAQSFQLQ